MAIIKYYLGLFWSAITGAWNTSQTVGAILGFFVGSYIEYRQPEWGPKMKNPLLIIPIATFLGVFLARLILAPYEKHKNQQQQIVKLKKGLAKIKKQQNAAIITTGTATIEVIIESDRTGCSDYYNYVGRPPHGYFLLAKKEEVFLEMTTDKIRWEGIENSEVRYEATFNLDARDKSVGKPISYLAEAKFAQIQFDGIPENSRVIRGSVICIFNSAVPIEISIPPNTMKDDAIIIPEIQKYFLGN